MTAGVAGYEQAWVSMGVSVLSSFAAGGPVAGGLAAIGAAVGILTRPSEGGISKYDKQVEKLTSSTSALRSKIAKLADELDRLKGVDLIERDFDIAREKVHALQIEAIEVDLKLRKLNEKKTSKATEDEIHKAQRLRRRLNALDELLPVEQAHLKELRMQFELTQKIDALNEAKRVQGLNEKIQKQVELMRELNRARNDFEKLGAQVGAQSKDIESQGASPKNVEAFQNAAFDSYFADRGKALDAQLDALKAEAELLHIMQPLERERVKLAQQLARAQEAVSVPESAPEDIRAKSQAVQDQLADNFLKRNQILVDSGVDEFQRFADSIGTQASDALSAGIMDGALNGFENMQSIARSLFSSIGNQGLNLAIKAGFSFLGSFAEGGDFIADRPSFIQVGEAGAERVRIEPLTGSRAGRGGDGGGGGENISLTLNVQGGLGNLTRQEIKNLVKSAYLEVATRGNSVRRINASQSKRSLY